MTDIQDDASPRFSPRLLLAAVLAVTAAAYLWTLQFAFVYDDLGQIVANPFIQSWSYFPQYFRGNVWMQQSPIGNYYRPIFLTWLLINHTLFGAHAAFWHLTTVLAHLGATALVFVLAQRWTRSAKTAAVAALLFGVHPAHLESVAWISGVTDPLLALFLIPSFLAFMNYREKRGARWLALSVGLFAFALLAKETAIVLPALLVVYVLLCPEEAWQQKFADAGRAILPYAGVTFVYLMARSSALGGLAHHTAELPANVALYTIPSVVWFYFKTLLVPAGLSAFYDTPYVTHVSFRYFLGPLLGVALVLGVLAVWWWRARSPLVPLATAWLLLPLAPVLNLSLLPLGDFAHDRYLYLPSIGFALLLAIALIKLDAISAGRFALGSAIAVVLGLFMVAGTVAQSAPWKDDLPLYAHGMKVAPNNDLPRNKLAATFVARGMYPQGIRLYRFVLSVDPDYWYANYRMGYAQYMTGHYAEAQRYLAKSVADHPVPDALFYLGLADTKLGQAKAAEDALRAAIKLDANVPGYFFALGTALKEQGRSAEALDAFRAALDRDPNDPSARQQVEELSRSETGARK